MRLYAISAIIFLILTGCKPSPTVKFCEGKSPEGEEINCGKAFSPGDLTLMVLAKENFGVSKLTVTVYAKKKIRKEKVNTFTMDVKPDESRASSDIRFYEEGAYVVDVIGSQKQVVGNGEVRIIDVY